MTSKALQAKKQKNWLKPQSLYSFLMLTMSSSEHRKTIISSEIKNTDFKLSNSINLKTSKANITCGHSINPISKAYNLELEYPWIDKETIVTNDINVESNHTLGYTNTSYHKANETNPYFNYYHNPDNNTYNEGDNKATSTRHYLKEKNYLKYKPNHSGCIRVAN